MQTRVCLFLALMAAAALQAQSQAPAPAPAEPEMLKEEVFVRRVSLGATLSVGILKNIKTGSAGVVTTSPALDSLFGSVDNSKRVGYGFVAQIALTDRIAVAGNLLVRKMGYKKNADVYQGVDNPTTVKDERTHVVTNEDTRARFIDIPVLLRYYTKDRYMSGPRGFVQAGAVLRKVSRITTAIDKVINDGTKTCCDNTPATPARSAVRGFVGGAGFQLIDGVGVRVVPEVRYTRWMAEPFSSPSTASQRNQIEAMVSLTF